MGKPTVWDWIGGTVIWGMASLITGAFVTAYGRASIAIGIAVGFALFAGGLVAARIWVLGRSAHLDQPGLGAGEPQLTLLEEMDLRLAELEVVPQRLAELEERVDFSERLLANKGQSYDGGQPHA